MSVREALEAHIKIRLKEGADREDIIMETVKWVAELIREDRNFDWPFDLIRKDHGGA